MWRERLARLLRGVTYAAVVGSVAFAVMSLTSGATFTGDSQGDPESVQGLLNADIADYRERICAAKAVFFEEMAAASEVTARATSIAEAAPAFVQPTYTLVDAILANSAPASVTWLSAKDSTVVVLNRIAGNLRAGGAGVPTESGMRPSEAVRSWVVAAVDEIVRCTDPALFIAP